jgi:hypothetical protein
VQVVPGLLDQIARLVQDGYTATSHGGLEIGGLLFGRRSSGSVTVEEFRPLACDHSLGPRFILSERDERDLRDLLKAPATDPALRGLDVIGWYCSHTRSELLLFDREVVLHHNYFSDPVDFVIVFKPRDLRSVTAGIFLRGADRIMDPRCPAKILELPELVAPRGANGTVTRHASDVSGFSCHPVPRIANECTSISSQVSRRIEPAASDQSTGERSAVIGFAVHKSKQHSRKAGKSKLLLAAGAAIALLCVGAWRYTQRAQIHPADLFLSLRPHAENLLLSWKSNVAKPQRARVDIYDGISSQHLNITDIFEPSGVLLFPHQSGNVKAVLTLETGNRIVVRHAGFADLSAVAKDPALPADLNPPNRQLALTAPATNHPRRRHARRTHHKKLAAPSTKPIPKQLQANQSP